jgi:hypothetical protein
MRNFFKKAMKEKNRRQRKQRWLRAKNLMRQHPTCAYNGDFYCDHVYEEKYPWTWVDFRFFHTKLKRYFSVAMRTAEMEAYDIAKDTAWEKVEAELGHDTLSPIHSIIQPGSSWAIRMQRYYDIMEVESKVVRAIKPSIKAIDYGDVAVGLFVTVNKEHIDEHVIREFIEFFRSLGEPTTPGWTHYGQEIQISAERFFYRPNNVEQGGDCGASSPA